MTGDWIVLSAPHTTQRNELQAKVHFETNSAWFSGHFPGQPVLPGVAILAAAARLAVKGGLEDGRPVDVLGFKKVRFTQLVSPGEELIISLSPARDVEEEKVLPFAVLCRGRRVCHGGLLVGYAKIAST